LLISKAARNAQIELQRRKDAREHLIDFTKYTYLDYKPVAIHKLIACKLDEVEQKKCSRLMIMMPPRHGKTELASRRFPAWYLGRHPTEEIIGASYNDELATEFGRDVRNIVGSQEYQCLFPSVKLSQDSQAKDRWHIQGKKGSYLAAGRKTGITGHGANVLIVDDPFKDRADAESEVFRKAVWDWYVAVAYTRLEKDAAIILIQTRWHEDDLAGRLMIAEAEGSGDKWDKVILPAIDNQGNALWPEKYPVEVLKQKRSVMGEMEWCSLFEQQPRPFEGSYFSENSLLMKTDDGTYLPLAEPKRYHTVAAFVDCAAKDGKTNDGTAVVYTAKSTVFDPPIAILDWDIVQMEAAMLTDWLPTVFQKLEYWSKKIECLLGSAGVWIEDKSAGIVLLQQAAKIGTENVYPIDSKLTSLGKMGRGLDVSQYVYPGMVKLTKHAYEKTVSYKGRTRNHLLAQILNFRVGTKDMGEDDLFDAWAYSISTMIGNSEGF